MNTPAYIFSEKTLSERIMGMLNIIGNSKNPKCSDICYAIKANPFLVPLLDKYVTHYEVCSPGELEICRHYGIDGNKIIFSGVVKTKEQIKIAMDYSVGSITIESISQWNSLIELLHEKSELGQKCLFNIYPRLSSGAQFGVNIDELRQIFGEIKDYSGLKLAGIHYFTGTQKKTHKYEEELDYINQVISDIVKEYHYSQDKLTLEYGPGLAVPYFTNDDFSNPLGEFKDLIEYIRQQDYKHHIRIELGRYIAASCGRFVSQVMDVKLGPVLGDSDKKTNYVLIDGGINHLNYYGSNMAMRTPIIHHMRDDIKLSGLTGEHNCEPVYFNIAGSLCTFADILARKVPLNNPQIGDILIFENAGAYSVTEASALFLSRDLPEIVIEKENGELVVVRQGINSYSINMNNSEGYVN